VLIDILCDQMHQAQLSARNVRAMSNLLWRKEIVGFKSLPYGLALSLFSTASILLRQIKFCQFVVRFCNMLMTWRFPRLMLTWKMSSGRWVQSTWAGFNQFFWDIGLSIPESKSELVLFSRKHTNPSVCVTLNGQCMSVVPEFRYRGVVFHGKLLWSAHVHYILRSMQGWKGFSIDV
jgi:hypothetical protein